MTANKDSPEVAKFLSLFGKLKDWSEDDPKSLPDLASKDESIKDLCLELLLAAGSIQKNERSDRKLFIAPVDSKFVSAWRDFEERYAHVLMIVRSNAVEAGDAHLILSFDWYEQPPRWEDADWEAARAAELIERMIVSPYSQVDGDLTKESTTDTTKFVRLNSDALAPEAKALFAELRASYTKFEAMQNELLAGVKQDCDEKTYRALAEQIENDREELLGRYDPKETAKWAKIQWKSLKDEAGFDLRGVLRRRALVPFVLFPRHVAAHHNQDEKLSIYENLRQAHEAFVFGAPSAALALMRSTMEVVLRDHYGAQGDDLPLYERINNSRKLLPSSANAAALHRLRMIANAVLHLDNERNEALPRLEPVELEKEILRLLRVLRDLIEGAPQWQQLRTQYGSNK